MTSIFCSASKLYKRKMASYRFRCAYYNARRFLKDNPQPDISSVEKDEIDNYWHSFGIHFKDYSWFQMYYGVTGMHNPRFIPDPLAGYILYPYYNDQTMIAGWDDKNLYQELISSVHFPRALGHCVRGRLYDSTWNYYDKNTDLTRLSDKIFQRLDGNELIIKATRSTAAGKGVKKLIVKSAADIKNYLLSNNLENFVIQEKVEQHPFFSQFNESSVNIIRIVSWRHNGTIKTFPACIRYGIKGSCTDVTFQKGKEIVNVVGLTEDGEINNRFATLDGLSTNECMINIKTCPSYKQMIESVINAHSHIIPFEVIGWDFTIDRNCMPICVEYNIVWPGTVVYQYANGPFAGRHSDEFLSCLKLPELQKKTRQYSLLF